MESMSSCPVCGSTKLFKKLSCKDYVASGERFELTRCGACSFLFTNPRPNAMQIGRYYQSDRYVSHAGSKERFSFMYKVYDVVRDFSIKNKLTLMKKYHTSGKLMDLGCGLGYFLNGVHLDKTFDAIGVDISEDAIMYVKKTFGHHVYAEHELDGFDDKSFDIITQWHVLEHVHLLNERMMQLKRLLHNNGTLFIAVPNSDSWDAQHYGEYWDGYDVPRHLYHFNKKSFSLLMQNHGFEVVDVKSMPFDAPYISMRSEVHKGNKLEFVRGAIKGAASTLSAVGTGNHSSLLFIVKHRQ
jgi:2-polyprenyl-3-methyl-5-hydroxy-6-metoxy-1,4-benzoquinol methylase